MARGWGSLEGRFTFVHISREEFEQNPLSLRKQVLEHFRELQRLRLVLTPSSHFGARLVLTEKSYQLYHFLDELHYRSKASLEDFVRHFFDKEPPERGKILLETFYPQADLELTLDYLHSPSRLKVVQKGQEASLPIPSTLDTFYLWLNLESSIQLIELEGRIPLKALPEVEKKEEKQRGKRKVGGQ